MTTTPLIEMRHVSKAFPGVQALKDVSLAAYGSEVHMLVGQNGAGKSTLIKILCGAYRPDQGEFLLNAKPVHIDSTRDARRLGVAVIFQEFSLVPYLDIAQNIFLGREFSGRIPGTIDRKKLHSEARRILELLGMDEDTRTQVHRLGVAQQQMVEIAKAISQDARVLVMDEPTAAISDREIDRLFQLIHKLRNDGIAIIYISHRMREVFEIGDRITVLRDGANVATLRPSETTLDKLVRLMVGREVDTSYRTQFCERPGELVLEVKNVDTKSGIRGASLTVRAGEIVGLAGLVGAGRTELARAIFGADSVIRGEVVIRGRTLRGSPVEAVNCGVGLVPENRKAEGLALLRSVHDNMLTAGLRQLFPHRWYTFSKARQAVDELIQRLRVVTPSSRRLARFLSGGNQQKVVIGKWLSAGSRIFIFDEPTRGIDVGAKAEIYKLMQSLVEQGAAVLVISSELPELVAVCDRAYVLRNKTIVGELQRVELTEENILRMAMQHG
ncbi:MAG TPA: sugar ABC transporter ATP-binding protein [Terriglobia bacterium]|nr:sugar ABC transporter ATP-binding protein [Terriglobia bacterium]